MIQTLSKAFFLPGTYHMKVFNLLFITKIKNSNLIKKLIMIVISEDYYYKYSAILTIIYLLTTSTTILYMLILYTKSTRINLL